jgi:hypothetical protein
LLCFAFAPVFHSSSSCLLLPLSTCGALMRKNIHRLVALLFRRKSAGEVLNIGVRIYTLLIRNFYVLVLSCIWIYDCFMFRDVTRVSAFDGSSALCTAVLAMLAGWLSKGCRAGVELGSGDEDIWWDDGGLWWGLGW